MIWLRPKNAIFIDLYSLRKVLEFEYLYALYDTYICRFVDQTN